MTNLTSPLSNLSPDDAVVLVGGGLPRPVKVIRKTSKRVFVDVGTDGFSRERAFDLNGQPITGGSYARSSSGAVRQIVGIRPFAPGETAAALNEAIACADERKKEQQLQAEIDVAVKEAEKLTKARAAFREHESSWRGRQIVRSVGGNVHVLSLVDRYGCPTTYFLRFQAQGVFHYGYHREAPTLRLIGSFLRNEGNGSVVSGTFSDRESHFGDGIPELVGRFILEVEVAR